MHHEAESLTLQICNVRSGLNSFDSPLEDWTVLKWPVSFLIPDDFTPSVGPVIRLFRFFFPPVRQLH